jgi:hypothetical protein
MFLVAGVGDLACGITVFSCHKILKIGITGDTANIPEPMDIAEIFDKNFEALLESGKQN